MNDITNNIIISNLTHDKNFHEYKQQHTNFKHLEILKDCPKEIFEMFEVAKENYLSVIKKIDNAIDTIFLDKEEIDILRRYFLLVNMLAHFNGEYKKPNKINPLIPSDFIVEETAYEYFWRSVRVILEVSNLKDILTHKDRTLEAMRWYQFSEVYTLSFVSTKGSKEEFLFNDLGFSVENDKVFKEELSLYEWMHIQPYVQGHEYLKLELLTYNFEKNTFKINDMGELDIDLSQNSDKIESELSTAFAKISFIMRNTIALYNFLCFPISSKKAILWVNPYFVSYNEEFKEMENIDITYWPSYLKKHILVPNYFNLDSKVFNHLKTLKPSNEDMVTNYQYPIISLKALEIAYLNMLTICNANKSFYYLKEKNIAKSINFTNQVLDTLSPCFNLSKVEPFVSLKRDNLSEYSFYRHLISISDYSVKEKKELKEMEQVLKNMEEKAKELNEKMDLESNENPSLES